MLLKEWLDGQGWGSREKLARSAGVSRVTIRAAELRAISRIKIARRISAATGGQVSPDELLPAPPKTKRAASGG